MADVDSKQKKTDDESTEHKKHHGKRGSGGGGILGGLLGGGILPVLQEVLGTRKHGGPVHKTGAYFVHKGERVIPASKTKIVGSQIGYALPAKRRSTKQARTKIVGSQARK